MSRHLISLHITSLYIISHHFVTSPHFTLHHFTSTHITSPHLTSHHLTLHHFKSPHITSTHITPPHITLLHVRTCAVPTCRTGSVLFRPCVLRTLQYKEVEPPRSGITSQQYSTHTPTQNAKMNMSCPARSMPSLCCSHGRQPATQSSAAKNHFAHMSP